MAKVLSVEIGASLIYMCEADYKSKSPKVYKRVTIPTPEGTVREDGIEVNEALVSAMKEGLRAGKIGTKKMVFTLNSTKIASREVVIPFVKENKVAEVIRANASDFFPVDVEQYELGHTIVGIQENDKGVKQYRIQVLAVPKTMIQGFRDLAKALGKSIEAFDYSGNSLYQMIRSQCDTGVQMVVKVGERSSIITVLKDSAIALQRTISYGMDEAVTAVAHTSFAQDGSYMQALDLLMKNNCLDGDFATDDSGIIDIDDETGVSQTVQEEVGTSLGYLVSGISRVVDYYNSRNTEAVIEKAYVTGIGGDCKGMEDFLSRALDLRVVTLRELEGFRLEKDFKGESFGRYLTCIGAVIAPLGFIGEKAEKGKKMEIAPQGGDIKVLSILVCVGGVFIGLALALVSYINLVSVRAENKELQARVTELEPIKEIYRAYLQQKYTHTKLNYLYNSTVLPGEDLVEFIEELEQKMPSSLNVQSFTAGREGVNMSLTVKDKREASKLIQQLRTFDSISNVAVSGISDTGAVMKGEPMEQEGKVSFSVTLTYKGADELAAEQMAKEAAEAAIEETTEETTEETVDEIVDDLEGQE